MAERWHRNAWLEAVWTSQLRPLERLVACCYADYARDRDRAWLTLDTIRERTALSRDAAIRARTGLIRAGWLVQVSEPNRRRAAVFRLVSLARVVRETDRSVVRETYYSVVGLPTRVVRETDASSLSRVPNLRTYLRTDLTQEATRPPRTTREVLRSAPTRCGTS